MIKRYTPGFDPVAHGAMMMASDDGEWVKWEDVAALNEALDRAEATLRIQRGETIKGLEVIADLRAEIDRLKAELKNAVEYNDQDFEVIESISKERDRLNAELAEAQDLIDSLEGDPEQVMWKVAACKAERARIVAVLHKVRDRWARQSSWWVAANSAIKAIEADA